MSRAGSITVVQNNALHVILVAWHLNARTHLTQEDKLFPKTPTHPSRFT